MVERNRVSRWNAPTVTVLRRRVVEVTARWGLGLSLSLSCALASAAPQPGDVSVKFPINDDDPVASVPSVADRNNNPLEFAHHLQDLIARADGAQRGKDYEKASKYFEALAREVPNRAVAFSRLCVIYAKLGRTDVAAANCGKATQLDGAKVVDHLRFVTLSLQKAKLTDKELADIDASLVHLRDHSAKNAQPLPAPASAPPHAPAEAQEQEAAKPAGKASAAAPGRDRAAVLSEILRRQNDDKPGAAPTADAKPAGATPAGATPANAKSPAAESPADAADEAGTVPHLATQIEVLDCKVASRLRDGTRLAKCIGALQALNASERTLLPFAWLQAILEKDASRAEGLLEDARKLGVNEATLQGMQTEQDKAFGGIRFIRWSLGGLAVLLLVGGVVALLRNAGRGKPNLPAEASAG